jgi:cellobiose epimerase
VLVPGLKQRVETELRSNILPFWLKYTLDEEFGGFRGQITNDLVIDPKADKGLILNARILWTFSKAYSVYHEDTYLQTAKRAYDYLVRYFWDAEFGGGYWMLNYLGEPADTKKRVYGQAFALYALAEYYLATRSDEVLQRAIRLYEMIEKTSRDPQYGGYFETYERDWTLAGDQRLSEVDMDEKKSMNTHLHVMEAYANLRRVWDENEVRERLGELIELFLDHVINPKNHHFLLFFDEDWTPKSSVISFGHDIEGSWLLCEAAEIHGDSQLIDRSHKEAVRMAQAVYDEAIDSDGGLLYEAEDGKIIDSDKHWWPQSEAVVGFLNAFQLSGQEEFCTAAERSWDFIDKYIVDHKHGEWFWKVSREGLPSNDKYKVDPWKCPYHNSRTCFEVMARLGAGGSHAKAQLERR